MGGRGVVHYLSFLRPVEYFEHEYHFISIEREGGREQQETVVMTADYSKELKEPADPHPQL